MVTPLNSPNSYDYISPMVSPQSSPDSLFVSSDFQKMEWPKRKGNIYQALLLGQWDLHMSGEFIFYCILYICKLCPLLKESGVRNVHKNAIKILLKYFLLNKLCKFGENPGCVLCLCRFEFSQLAMHSWFFLINIRLHIL